MGRLLSALGNRVFLMHNVHEDAPEVFESRWAMSYLRGPLTRSQIKILMDPRRAEFAAAGEPAPASSPRGGAAGASQRADGRARPPRADQVPQKVSSGATRPVLPPDIQQFFAPAAGAPSYAPMLLGSAEVRFIDAKCGVDEARDVLVVTPIEDAAVAVDWARATEADFALQDLSKDPAGGRFVRRSARGRAEGEELRRLDEGVHRVAHARADARPAPQPIARTWCRSRVRTSVTSAYACSSPRREARDAQVAALRQKYAPRMQALAERQRRAEQAVAREQEQVTSSRLQTGISMATTVFGAMFGRKTFSASTLGRATTAARGVGRSMKESQDVGRAQENVAAIQAQIQELEASLQADIAAAEEAHTSSAETLETLSLKPKRTGVQVKLVALAWVAR